MPKLELGSIWREALEKDNPSPASKEERETSQNFGGVSQESAANLGEPIHAPASESPLSVARRETRATEVTRTEAPILDQNHNLENAAIIDDKSAIPEEGLISHEMNPIEEADSKKVYGKQFSQASLRKVGRYRKNAEEPDAALPSTDSLVLVNIRNYLREHYGPNVKSGFVSLRQIERHLGWKSSGGRAQLLRMLGCLEEFEFLQIQRKNDPGEKYSPWCKLLKKATDYLDRYK
jgi:hypothetical protein